ncbi:YbaN family protein [Vannielia litorea]|uniref:YbaN family protein n=1 Tax=Vannielia litorea TaxID=1217970 RepID=UPI001C96ECD9|nr:YbaN family protein [Vannielia litorea]MBY6049298.1 YbaN family protein [Vannielia litorea]MBY6076712.1 YbaN family protein [Vannielia litorea]
MRALWGLAGSLALLLGLLGVILPLLPTVPFVLLAAFCFARSSDRLHRWLVSHRSFGPMIENWQSKGTIGRSAKIAVTLSVVVVFSISVGFQLASEILIIQCVILSCVMLFIWTRPEA